MDSNGDSHHPINRPLTPGIFAPIPTFFLQESEDIDIPSFEAHVLRVAHAGVSPLIAGSMGEAIHLARAERTLLIKAARKALDGAGHYLMPIIAGTGAASTRETLELCSDAAAAGADYCIVIASGYFAGVWGRNKDALRAFFVEVAQRSPIPVMIYNYPAASSGIDLDSDMITQLSQECPNICGVKLTCGDVGKLTRIASFISTPSFSSCSQRTSKVPFLIYSGFCDTLLSTAFANGNGAIVGLGNVAPHAIQRLFQLSEVSTRDLSFLSEARRLQGIIARADCTIAKASIAGTKFLLERIYGYGGVPRRPLPPLDHKAAEALWAHPDTQALIELEHEISGKA